jgi:hypothetical protein
LDKFAEEPSLISGSQSKMVIGINFEDVDKEEWDELAMKIKGELKPYFDTDRIDKTGFFPETTQRASGLISISEGCIDFLITPILIDVVNAVLSSTYGFWVGEKLRTVASKSQISSTAGNPQG